MKIREYRFKVGELNFMEGIRVKMEIHENMIHCKEFILSKEYYFNNDMESMFDYIFDRAKDELKDYLKNTLLKSCVSCNYRGANELGNTVCNKDNSCFPGISINCKNWKTNIKRRKNE